MQTDRKLNNLMVKKLICKSNKNNEGGPMPKVNFAVEGYKPVAFEAYDNENLLETARRAGVFIDSPCNGNGTCSKCKVKLVEGQLNVLSHGKLTKDEIAEGYVLACRSEVKEDVTVAVPDMTIFKQKMQITDLSDNERLNLEYVRNRMMEKGMDQAEPLNVKIFDLPKPTIDDNLADEERLRRYFKMELGITRVLMSISILKKLPEAFRANDFRVEVVYRNRGTAADIIDVRPGYEKPSVYYGVALDIGTTSVVACLVNLSNFQIVCKASRGNAQAEYGGDVINRIVYSLKKNGLERLQEAILGDTINLLMSDLEEMAGVHRDDIVAMCCAGNTTMVHLLLGVNPDYLRRDPFIPSVNNVPVVKSNQLGIEINSEAYVYIAPSVGSYVGGDITAGVFAVPIWFQDDFTMLVDLGTNGEIVFGNKEFMVSCACSAGPAFEGGEITCGTRAIPGAIEKVTIDPETLLASFDTIGDQEPIGICGSGIIDLICEMKNAKIIDGRGRISITDHPRIFFDEYNIGRYYIRSTELDNVKEDVYITEVDIDNFIKAKAAVFSAIHTMLKNLDMPIDIIENIYIAGGIGTNINIRNAIQLGMLPDIDRKKYFYIGNTSMQGCYLTLTLRDGIHKIKSIANNMTYMELSVDPHYMDSFISASFIPHTDKSLFPSVAN